jgi:hypothetical protein
LPEGNGVVLGPNLTGYEKDLFLLDFITGNYSGIMQQGYDAL